jgi:hypothetical protein
MSTINDPAAVVRFQEGHTHLGRRGSVNTTTSAMTGYSYTTQGGTHHSKKKEKDNNVRSGTLALMTTLHAPSSRAKSPQNISPPGAGSGAQSNYSNYSGHYSMGSTSSSGGGSHNPPRGILRNAGGQPLTASPRQMDRELPGGGSSIGRRYHADNSDDILSVYEIPGGNRSRHSYGTYTSLLQSISFSYSSYASPPGLKGLFNEFLCIQTALKRLPSPQAQPNPPPSVP